MTRDDLLHHQREILDRLIAEGKLQRGDSFVSMPRFPNRATIDMHIDEDGVITFANAVRPVEIKQTLHADRGLNTDDFSQAPTIDADKSAEWNRKAKTVKPGSFAARRMAGEE